MSLLNGYHMLILKNIRSCCSVCAVLKRLYGSVLGGENGSGYVQGQSPTLKIREYFYYIDHHGQLFLDDARMKNFTSCFKDKEFLVFFFRRLRRNTTDRYVQEFPFLSLCGRERNFIRCDDMPVVFTHLLSAQQVVTFTEQAVAKAGSQNKPRKKAPVIPPNSNYFLVYGNADPRLSVPFQPSALTMSPVNGRIYHPGPGYKPDDGGHGDPSQLDADNIASVGLVCSSLALKIAKCFEFNGGLGETQSLNERSDSEDETFPVPSHINWSGSREVLTHEIGPLVNCMHERYGETSEVH